MTSNTNYRQEQIDAVRIVIQRTWLLLQTMYGKMVGGYVPMVMSDRPS